MRVVRTVAGDVGDNRGVAATDSMEGSTRADDRPAPGPRRVLRVVAWVLLAGWLGTAVAAVLLGELASDVDSLRSAIAAGDVDRVEVTGGLGAHARGSATIELRWSDHGLHYYAEVKQTRGKPPRGQAWHSEEADGRFTGNLADYLDPGDADLEIVHTDHSAAGASATWAGFRLGGGQFGVLVGLLLATLGVLAVADEPWRATGWAWCWLILVLPGILAPAYLLLGGPTGVARPKRPAARLTGGWAFLLSLLIGTAVNGLRN